MPCLPLLIFTYKTKQNKTKTSIKNKKEKRQNTYLELSEGRTSKTFISLNSAEQQ